MASPYNVAPTTTTPGGGICNIWVCVIVAILIIAGVAYWFSKK